MADIKINVTMETTNKANERRTTMTNNAMIELMKNNYEVAIENMKVTVFNVDSIPDEVYSIQIQQSDLAFVFLCKVDNNKYIKLTKEMVSEWEKHNNLDMMLVHAMETTERHDKIRIETLPGMIEMLGVQLGVDYDAGADTAEKKCLVVTTESGYLGASALFYHWTFDRLSFELGTREFMVIPSSIHEFLVLPFGAVDVGKGNEMVRFVNATEVLPAEQLANHVYYYGVDKNGNRKFTSLG